VLLAKWLYLLALRCSVRQSLLLAYLITDNLYLFNSVFLVLEDPSVF
jgi:hypothetical protein